ncbi:MULTISPECIES: hypothetical protein [Pontibacillus]|uniref:DUF8042 domain-containing protein n=1 Tax=Pontibacillus chungwhensis TaxID=265426 RepID=A0ABY8UVB6_9BACI|nr:MULTISPECIES: hypothetical protein [Pontibacillus]MCD5325901.1 hypothetical protein [Pontibacillus sp. HN14]WIF97611.1 hypothetical protein QNI29_18065 [Pontibacillus chungwhensis]
MVELTEEKVQFLQQYDQLLYTMSEGFDYIEENLGEEAPAEVDQVFSDLVQAMQQLHQGNQQLAAFIGDTEQLKYQIVDFQEIVEMMSEWFEKPTNLDKKSLISGRVAPNFESWRMSMHQLLKPYIQH